MILKADSDVAMTLTLSIVHITDKKRQDCEIFDR
jgi:hypothetical protein